MAKKKSKAGRIFGWLLLIIIIIAVAVYTNVDKGVEKVTGHAANVPEKQESSGSDKPAQIEQANSSGKPDVPSYTPDPEPDPEPQPDPEPGPQYPTENCNEYNCPEPGECYQGRCKEPECTKDEDCVDDDPCTPEKCYFAGHINAFCSDEVITEFRNHDGCCPVGAYVDDDIDCVPVCGDGLCEYGENTASCRVDCLHAGSGSSGTPAPAPRPQPEYD